MKKFLFLLLLYSSILLAEQTGAPQYGVYCDGSSLSVLSKFRPSDQGLKFVPIMVHDIVDRTSSIEDVLIKIDPGDDIEGIATALSMGNPSLPIYQRLIAAYSRSQSVEIPLKNILGGPVKRLTNTWARCSGPNCWNASLLATQVTKVVTHVTEKQMNSALKTFFRPLAPGARLKFGDVIAFNHGELTHTAIYIDDQIIWHKEGYDSDYPWMFDTSANLFLDNKNTEVQFFRYLGPKSKTAANQVPLQGALLWQKLKELFGG